MFRLLVLTICLLGTQTLVQAQLAAEADTDADLKTDAKVAAETSAEQTEESPESDGVFVPTEDIHEDSSVSFPIDI